MPGGGLVSSEAWREQRTEKLEQLTDVAHDLLVDRTVVHVVAVPHMDECDSANVLRLTLDNGVVVDIEGTYGGYTGHSHDEYVEYIEIHEVPR